MGDKGGFCARLWSLRLFWVFLMVLMQDVPRSMSAPTWNVVRRTRTVEIKQGQLKGIEVSPTKHGLKNVEVFLGIPYAAPPVGSLRFMPPGSPPPWWPRLKYAETMGPVCPQVFPDLHDASSGRNAYLKRLLPYLRNQSEDCLHLNVYAPVSDSPLGSRYPVIVFIHGESFQWNSGNPYDGSILASYTNVIVVTINFRLGVLGFLKTGMGSQALGNFGLLDQIAALQWVKENIHHFGGNPTSVTLLGHHTGAVAVNYLMLSPVVQADNGLFHRAILMSGSALADWAEVRNPGPTTIQVADALNCPPRSEDFLPCLRKKRVSDILSIPLSPSQLGPTVDGNVVPNKPKTLMAEYTDLFSRYDMLCGVTEAESYHMLNAVSLAYGMLEDERDKLLKEYFKNKFEMLPDLAQAKATAFYSELERGRSTALNTRDATVALLSDARVVAPVMDTAFYHTRATSHVVKTFVYVFSHISSSTEYSKPEKSVHGEDLPYVFGIPIDGPRFHFLNNYNTPEKLLSEVIMTLWSNFAKTGDPNHPKKIKYMTQSQKEWKKYDSDWPEYEKNNQAYYDIGIPTTEKYKYRDKMVTFWNEILPAVLLSPAPNILPPDDSWPHGRNWYSNPKPRRPTSRPNYDDEDSKPVKHAQKKIAPFDQHMDSPKPTEAEPEEHITTASSFTLSIIIFVGICFLLINVVSFLFICYQKRKLKKEISLNARYRCESSASVPDLENRYAKKKPEKAEVKSILKSIDSSYEPVKVKSEKMGKWPGMYRQGSSSTVTMDPHTKVTEWIAHEIVHRCSPSFLRKDKFTEKNSDIDRVSAATTSKIGRGSRHKKVKTVSVAVDATPSTRSASVLKQIPIELTKSLDNGSRKLGSRAPGRPILQRSQAVEDDEDDDLDSLQPAHSHSYSDPLVQSDDATSNLENPPPEETDVPHLDPSRDINVTCRDEVPESVLSPEEALDNIKRRNFPKVLPDFPDADSENDRGGLLAKRMSMPQVPSPQSEESPKETTKKVPPPPPPRVSTLGRKMANRNTIPNFMSSYGTSRDFATSERPSVRRIEPKVIIKPTITDPKLKRNNPQIPRVKHHTLDPENVEPPEAKEPPKQPPKPDPLPTTGMGAISRIPPVKRSVQTETSESSVSTDDTVKEGKKD